MNSLLFKAYHSFWISTQVGVSGNHSAPRQTPILGMLKRSGGKAPWTV
jgi:hypothetical protein